MSGHFAQTPEQLAQEIEFWRDFIHWWEHKNGRRASARVRAALAAAESRRPTSDDTMEREKTTAQAAKSTL